MNVRWITDSLGTGSAVLVGDLGDAALVDVRDLVDRSGNTVDSVRAKIQQGAALLASGKRVVICCDYGISRSNSVAAGVLAASGCSFREAVAKVLQATGETDINEGMLATVREALHGQYPRPPVQHQRTLITGGSGFLGQALRKRLSADFDIIAPTRQELDLERGSVPMGLVVEEMQVNTVVHLANPRKYTANAAMGQTLTMLRNVLDVCATQRLSLLYLSGWEIFSGYAGTLHAGETLPAHPGGIYGETKYLAEIVIERWAARTGLACAVLRSSPVYGPGSERPKFIHTFAEKARRGERITTHRYRNGLAALDLLHVEDLAAAVASALRARFRGVLHLGTGRLTSTAEVAAEICKVLASTSIVEQSDIDAEVACIAMDTRKALAELGWSPTVSLGAGLAQLFAPRATETG